MGEKHPAGSDPYQHKVFHSLVPLQDLMGNTRQGPLHTHSIEDYRIFSSHCPLPRRLDFVLDLKSELIIITIKEPSRIKGGKALAYLKTEAHLRHLC
jgi:hypothetical protein